MQEGNSKDKDNIEGGKQNGPGIRTDGRLSDSKLKANPEPEGMVTKYGLLRDKLMEVLTSPEKESKRTAQSTGSDALGEEDEQLKAGRDRTERTDLGENQMNTQLIHQQRNRRKSVLKKN